MKILLTTLTVTVITGLFFLTLNQVDKITLRDCNRGITTACKYINQ